MFLTHTFPHFPHCASLRINEWLCHKKRKRRMDGEKPRLLNIKRSIWIGCTLTSMDRDPLKQGFSTFGGWRPTRQNYNQFGDTLTSIVLQVCYRFRLTMWNDNFWVDFDHFWIEKYFLSKQKWSQMASTEHIISWYQQRSFSNRNIYIKKVTLHGLLNV